jgi:hypothetical protein
MGDYESITPGPFRKESSRPARVDRRHWGGRLERPGSRLPRPADWRIKKAAQRRLLSLAEHREHRSFQVLRQRVPSVDDSPQIGIELTMN